MPDTITTIGESRVQHGRCNDQIYLMHLAEADLPKIVGQLERLAVERGYSKIFAKVPEHARHPFLEGGYRVEACIPRLFRGEADGYFLARYLRSERSRARWKSAAAAAPHAAKSCSIRRPLPQGCRIVPAGPIDADDLAALNRTVFETYPFPIHDPANIRETMGGDNRYFCVRIDRRLVAASSAEVDAKGTNAEMTDFAVHPEFRGRGLCSSLLEAMECAMTSAGMITVYTIARVKSAPINAVFSRSGYAYAGRLVNNTNADRSRS